jgi:hypothetical protein
VEKYITAELEVIAFDNEDVVTTSCTVDFPDVEIP